MHESNMLTFAVQILPVIARILARPAAYIDPNTGGMLFQILAALLGVISAFLLFFSGRIKQAYYRLRRRAGKTEASGEDTEPSDPPVDLS